MEEIEKIIKWLKEDRKCVKELLKDSPENRFYEGMAFAYNNVKEMIDSIKKDREY